MPELTIEEKIALVKLRLSSLDRNLSEEQIDFILHPINIACYLKACPGSGKTEVVGIKAAYEIAEWKEKFIGMAILSFTKNAAKEIADRIKKFGGTNATQHPHFIGTIDSWLHGYILHPFAHKSTGYVGKNSDKSYRLVDNEEHYDFLTPFQTVFSYNPFKGAWVNDYYFECSNPVSLQSQSRTLDLTTISLAAKKELQENKKKFLKAGLATYSDAEFLCYYLLRKNESILENVVRRFPIIVIDECQDLSNNQLEILKLLNQKGAIIHFVGDNNQSIYEFKKVYVEKINAFISENKLKERFLTKNYRSNQKIVNVSIGLEKYNTGNTPVFVVGNEEERATKSCILWEYTADNFSQLPQKFINHLQQINTTIQNPELKIAINKSVILARAHATLSGFRSHPTADLSKIELFANALNCWANNPRTGKDMQNALQQIGKSISMLAYAGNGNHQHQYCPDTYNQIEWRNQLSDLIFKATNATTGVYPFKNLTWSQWVTKLKVFLENYWANLDSPSSDWDSVKAKIKSPRGYATKLVIETIKANQIMYSEKIRMTTIHDAKGETLDAVMLVSAKDKKSKGGHVEQWLSMNANEKEFVRFAYVASSRPKHLLIWAIPKGLNNQFKNKIIDLGFDIENSLF
ncbi:MAG: ATP-dependent helicase [Bacteroidia bacterium]|nr:ATP-dependent helicase [Bacteroidia bacterium]